MPRPTLLSSLAASAVAVFLVALLAAADWIRPEEPQWSSLYHATLQDAFSRFREHEKRVPAGGPEEEFVSPQPASAPQAAAGRLPAAQPPQAAHAQPAGKAVPLDQTTTELTQGNEFAVKKEYDKALERFRAHLLKFPNSAIAYHRIADVLQEQGKSDEAIAAYEEALKRQASYYCVHGHIGDLHAAQGRTEAAEQAYARLVAGFREQMTQPGPVAAGAKYQLSKFYIDHGRNLQEAIVLAEQAAAETPDQVAYLVPLVTAYRQMGRNADAAATIDKIVKLKPEFKAYYDKVREQLTAPQPKQ